MGIKNNVASLPYSELGIKTGKNFFNIVRIVDKFGYPQCQNKKSEKTNKNVENARQSGVAIIDNNRKKLIRAKLSIVFSAISLHKGE